MRRLRLKKLIGQDKIRSNNENTTQFVSTHLGFDVTKVHVYHL